MALALTSTVGAVRAPVAIRAAVSTGSRAPANLTVNTTPTQLMSRLDALKQKSKQMELPHAFTTPTPTEGADEVLFSSHFGDYRLRMQVWWKEHLEDKAALVQAAAPESVQMEEAEPTVHLEHPVDFDWLRDRYPARMAEGDFMSRF